MPESKLKLAFDTDSPAREMGLISEEALHRGYDAMICRLYNELCYSCPQYLCDIRKR